jgi:hypothetical protein
MRRKGDFLSMAGLPRLHADTQPTARSSPDEAGWVSEAVVGASRL